VTVRFPLRLFPERLDDWIGEDSLVRVVDLFVDLRAASVIGWPASPSHRGITPSPTDDIPPNIPAILPDHVGCHRIDTDIQTKK
jgi:hypothetical protein